MTKWADEKISYRIRKRFREWLMWRLEPYWAGCWAKLVMWAEFPTLHNSGELFEIAKSPPQSCINDIQGQPFVCYCGRYRITGPTNWGGSESIVWDAMAEAFDKGS